MGKALRKTIGIALLVLPPVLIGVIALFRIIFEVSILDSVRSIQAVFTIIAITIGAIFAYFKLELFREFEPHLTINQNVSHRLISDEYVHIAVTAFLHNSSKVAVEIREALFRLQQISPLSDEEIQELYNETFIVGSYEHIQWQMLDEINHNWQLNKLIIEPGESHAQTYEFIVSIDVATVLIYAYFHNPRYSTDDQATQGWATTSVHDVSIHRTEDP